MQIKIRERSVDPSFLDLTDLLGDHLIAAGFRLFNNHRGQHIVFAGKDIKRHPTDRYSLKAIKRYCRLYLQKNIQNSLPAVRGHPDRVGTVSKADIPTHRRAR